MPAIMRARIGPAARPLGLVLSAVITLTMFTGCMPKPAPPTRVTPSSTIGPTAAAAPTATPKPTAAPWTPVSIDCAALLTPTQLSRYDPTFVPDPDYKPTPGTDAATIQAGSGTVCGWKNPDGATIEIGVGQPPEARLTALNNTAIGVSHAVPTYGIPPAVWGYFSRESNAGEAQVFQSGHWVIWRSTTFLEPGDPAPLVAAVQANLPTG